jgi:hypothetical protein
LTTVEQFFFAICQPGVLLAHSLYEPVGDLVRQEAVVVTGVAAAVHDEKQVRLL